MTTTESERACVERIRAALAGVPRSWVSRSLWRLLRGEVDRPRLPHAAEASRLSGKSQRWLLLGERSARERHYTSVLADIGAEFVSSFADPSLPTPVTDTVPR